MKDECLYYVYQTTNLVNGKIYIGVHQSQDIGSDRYIGSGKRLKLAIQKHGRINFERDILQVFKDKSEAFMYERSLVDEEFVEREDTYNVTTGGGGSGGLKGEDHPNYGLPMPQEIKEKVSESVKKFYAQFEEYPEERREVYRKSRKAYFESIGGTHPEDVKQKISETLKGKYCGEDHPFYGKQHSDATKKIISDISKSRWETQDHPMLGKPRTEETKNKIRATLENKPKATCQHCGKHGYEWSLKRYHFENCKLKKTEAVK